MKTKAQFSNLPNDIAALWFACQCFDIREKDFGNDFRVVISRAIAGKTSEKRREDVEDKLLHELLRRFRVAGVSYPSNPNDFADNVTTTLLSIYRQLRPRLKTDGVSPTDALWILSEHVILPTLYLKVAEFRNLGLGTGTEFTPEAFWYMPSKQNGKVVKPIPRVLDFWLGVARLNTGYGLERHLRPTSSVELGNKLKKGSTKHRVERWLNGKVKPTLEELLDYIDNAAARVSWLDGAVAWKARLTLAFAMQSACDRADDFFCGIPTTPSLKLAERFRKLQDEQILTDDDGILRQLGTFFASRLLQRQLRRTGELQKILRTVPKQMGKQFAPDAPDEQVERFRLNMIRQMNPGNALAEHVLQKAQKVGFLNQSAKGVDAFIQIQEYIFQCGVEELNNLLARKRKEGRRAKTRRP